MSSKTLPRSLQRASGATAHWNFNPTPKSHSLRSAHHPRFFCSSKLQLGFDVHAPNTHKSFLSSVFHIWVLYDHSTALRLRRCSSKLPAKHTDPVLILLLLSSSSPLLSSRFSPLPSRRHLVFLQLPYARFFCPFPPISTPLVNKRVKYAILFLIFLFP
jgi:hypothetical protein